MVWSMPEQHPSIALVHLYGDPSLAVDMPHGNTKVDISFQCNGTLRSWEAPDTASCLQFLSYYLFCKENTNLKFKIENIKFDMLCGISYFMSPQTEVQTILESTKRCTRSKIQNNIRCKYKSKYVQIQNTKQQICRWEMNDSDVGEK